MKKLLSTVLAILLIFSICPFGLFNSNVSAAIVTLETINEGEVWHKSWSSDKSEQTVKFKAEKTGFYEFTVTDHKKTGFFMIKILDTLEDDYVYYNLLYNGTDDNPQPIDTYTISEILLAKGGEYEISCSYHTYDSEEDTFYSADAEISLKFNLSDYTPTTLPNCDVNKSNIAIVADFEDNWLKYKTTTAGDYSFNFSPNYSCGISVTIYSAESGKELVWDNNIYYDDYDDCIWKERIVFNLDANTEYYICVYAYGYDYEGIYVSNTTHKISMTKNSKTVKSIEVNESIYDITCFWDSYDITADCFNYKIIYQDNTSEIVSYYDVIEMGYNLPEVEYLGDSVIINGRDYLQAGVQSVASTYNGITTYKNIYIESLTDYCSNLKPVGENNNCIINYEDNDYHTYYWRVKMSESGIYGIKRYNSDDFGTNFGYYSITVVDQFNNKIEPSTEGMAIYPLKANQEYCLVFSFRYNPSYSWNDITFWFKKDGEIAVAGWKVDNNGWWYQKSDGSYAIGWNMIGGDWYYFNSSGYMQTGWTTISGSWYYFNASGQMATGWQWIGNAWYYFYSDGSMATSTWIGNDYVTASGAMGYSTWQLDGNGWWYQYADGSYATGWQVIGGSWYYFNASGYAVTGWQVIGGTWYYFNAGGDMVTGWASIGGTWYYFNAGGDMATGWALIGGSWYYFYADGSMASNCYVGGYWLTASGTMA